ncbi:MAG: AAA family ATPase [Parcubacteria group bacterium]|jgi:dephospho-CoA kinase
MTNKKIIIGLVGETGSGKDTVANYLAEKYGARLLRFADPIKEVLRIFFEQSSKQDQQWLYLQLRERFGSDVLGKALRRKVENADGIIVVNGLRMPDDYVFIKSFENSYIIYTTADQKLRWERVHSRGEKSDDKVSFEKFQEIERAETEVHIPEIGAKADFVIRNEKDLEFLLKSTDEVMAKIMR